MPASGYRSPPHRGNVPPMRLYRALFLLVSLSLVSGCGLFKQLQVESVSVGSQKPSNVAAYVAVNDGDEPVTDLTEQNFRIYENEQLLSPDEIKQTLIDRNAVALHHVLLLIDVSNAKDDATRAQLARGVAGFITHVRKSQGVTVYAFDGSAEPKLVGEYKKGESGPNDIPELSGMKSTDPSRNLHGAVIAGVKELGARLMSQQKPVRVGTLVVLTAGPDLAGRATPEQMQQALDGAGYQLVAIGIGDEKSFDLGGLGKNGTFWSPSLGGTGPVLDDVASRVEALMQHFYLIAYCSPARAGKRHIRIEVVHTNTEGNERKGDFDADFDASGFGPGCDPQTTPRFGAADVSTEPSESEGKAEGDKAPAKSDTKKPDTKKPDDKKPEGDTKKPEGQGDEIVPPPSKPGYAPVNK